MKAEFVVPFVVALRPGTQRIALRAKVPLTDLRIQWTHVEPVCVGCDSTREQCEDHRFRQPLAMGKCCPDCSHGKPGRVELLALQIGAQQFIDMHPDVTPETDRCALDSPVEIRGTRWHPAENLELLFRLVGNETILRAGNTELRGRVIGSRVPWKALGDPK